MDSINLIINNKQVTGQPGETILDVAQRHNIEIPTLCHDKRLEPYSSCFLCVVEVEGMRSLQTACSTRIAEGMKIQTGNERVRKARKTALELMMSNHYADCVAPCKQTCPAGVDVQGYISLIEKGMYSEAIELIKEVNPLPAICGRVCVRPCEVACRRNLLGEGAPVGIDYLKRFAADQDLDSDQHFKPALPAPSGKKVAIIGAGPGGLSAAYFLQRQGHHCDLFEAAPKAGGWLRYGIPEYRLPNDLLDREVATVTELGANIFYNRRLGENLSYSDIVANYQATILTVGSQKGTRIGCEGDEAGNIFPGIDFLKNMEVTGQKYDFKGKTIAVVGGGNTAMDCCRTSIRCGADRVVVIYRRTEAEMPANPIEIHESKLEGVEYMFLTNPVRVNSDVSGNVKSLTCLRMELGEPDASGRRRPVPVEGSDFDVEVDFVLAAIGQKTDVNFLNDINQFAPEGELKVNRWGDIDADKKSLATGIPGVFAAGDGVSGPATIIEAIAQARIASRSCHLFLTGSAWKPESRPYVNRKDLFREQSASEYLGRFKNRKRHEMPTLAAHARMNFQEVELGYRGAAVAEEETSRCLECGCTAFFQCDLQKYCTEYEVSQNRFEGEFYDRPIDFSHPFIEIDNNKCILCARCVRICSEVVGAHALGLINRGFSTLVAPALGGKLTETHCESCGMCISACPTGALSENLPFKPGPVHLETVDTICPYCSIGCSISLHHKNGFVMKVTGKEGLVNKDGNICKYPRFGYSFYNDRSRITRPLLRENGSFREISFEEAYDLILARAKAVLPDENAFYASSRLTNEELYMIQKLARAGIGTNHVASFSNMGGARGYVSNAQANVPFHEIAESSHIFLLGAEISLDHGVISYMVNSARLTKGIPVTSVTEREKSAHSHKVDKEIQVTSYYHFVKAVNHYLLKNGLQNQLYINDLVSGFDAYRSQLLKEDFETLAKASGVEAEVIAHFAESYNREMNAVLIFSERQVAPETSTELHNLAKITGKAGKRASGLISLKLKNNTQGTWDMGVCTALGPGAKYLADEATVQNLKTRWGMESFPLPFEEVASQMFFGEKVKNCFIFGEDPVGCAREKEKVKNLIENAGFVMVQDYFMTETAQLADLILPASFPVEIGGTFTNTQKVIQQFESVLPSKIEKTSLQQLIELLGRAGVPIPGNKYEIMLEVITLLPCSCCQKGLEFVSTDGIPRSRFFNHGADTLVKRFDDYFEMVMNH